MISPNALAEFRLVTGPMKAEFGRNSGAVVIVTAKSGGNRLHGVAAETFRNTKLNAVPFFQKSVPGGTAEHFSDGSARKPALHLNDFDVNLRGPIRKDRTFFSRRISVSVAGRAWRVRPWFQAMPRGQRYKRADGRRPGLC